MENTLAKQIKEVIKLYPLDTTGTNPINFIHNEMHTVNFHHDITGTFIIPKCAPFFMRDFVVEFKGTQTDDWIELKRDRDWEFQLMYRGATEIVSAVIYGGIEIKNQTLNGQIRLRYRTLGGDQILDTNGVYREILEHNFNPREKYWDEIAKTRCIYPPLRHEHNIEDTYGYKDMIEALYKIAETIAKSNEEAMVYIKDKVDKYDPCKFEYMFNALAEHSFLEIVDRMQLLEEKQREMLALLMFEKYMDIIDALDKYSFADLVARQDKLEAEFEELKKALDIDAILLLLNSIEGIDFEQIDKDIANLKESQIVQDTIIQRHTEELEKLKNVSAKDIEYIDTILASLVDWHCTIMNGYTGPIVTMAQMADFQTKQNTINVNTTRDLNSILLRLEDLEK